MVNYLSIDVVVDVEFFEDDAEGLKAPSYPKHKEQLCVEDLRFAFLVSPWIKMKRNAHRLLPKLSFVVVVLVLAVVLHALVSHTLRLDDLPDDEGEDGEVDDDDEQDRQVVEKEHSAHIVPTAAEEAPLLLAHPGVQQGGGGQDNVEDGQGAGEQERNAKTHGGRDSQRGVVRVECWCVLPRQLGIFC